MRLPWRKSETQRRKDAMARDLHAMQRALAEPLTPIIRRAAVDLEVGLDKVEGRWNRHQMRVDR